MSRATILALLGSLFLPACTRSPESSVGGPRVLRVAVTTSTRDSGLLDVLVPLFEKNHDARVDIVAVGTGAALKLGSSGDADVVFVHARTAEDAFMKAGHGIRREDVMFNTFEILGPKDDPAGIRGLDSIAAMHRIAEQQAKWISRGDDSGTHKRETKLWDEAGGLREWSGFVETGQGMGPTLTIADEVQGYVLCDRGTYLKFREKVDLVPLAKQSETLKNPYGAMVVDPRKNDRNDDRLAQSFVDFLIAPQTQRLIRDYRIAGEPLFHPLRLPDEK